MLDLGRQFRTRLDAWREELGRQLYTPVGAVRMEGFTTRERLSPREAESHAFRAFPEGTDWGACWEYGWFRGDVTIPADCAGRRIVLMSRVGGEQLVYVNGAAAGSIDKGHAYVTLTRDAVAGETFHVLIEAYAGHGARLENATPCPPERAMLPPVPDTQCRTGQSIIAVWNEDAYQLSLDVLTLDQLLHILPDRSLRAQRVAAALQAFMDTADPELPCEERRQSFRAAREALRDALGCHNGSTAPLMWLIGQSHIDLAWLWPMEETYHKSVRTYAKQVALMDEYPQYQWLLCEPALLDMLRSMDGALWQRVQDAHRRGQVRPEGAFYVECDTNLPSGESIIRQLLWGRQWFRDQFGMESLVAWLPDCFGFSGALPQLLRGMGVPFFATQKLLRADPECEPFPYQHFVWEGIDGSEVLGLSFMRYNGPISPQSFKERWEDSRTQTTGIDTLLHPFGYGDGGGGPTRDMVEMSLRLRDLEGVPRSRYGGVREYFEHIARQGTENRWVGEMYLSWHRGVFSSQRRGKMLMRQAEFALHDAEALAARMPCADTDREELRELWRMLLLSQFHDVAGGVSIKRVHDEAEADLRGVIDRARAMTDRLRREAFGIGEGEGIVAFNALPWDRTQWLPDAHGQPRYVTVPADGASQLTDISQPRDASAAWDGDELVLENVYLRLTIAADGAITALTDKRTGVPLLRPGQKMNDWRLYKNVQTTYDAWELDRDWEKQLIPCAMRDRITLLRTGPELCEVRVERSFGSSCSEQRIRLYAGSAQVEFETRIDWHERHRMLKTHFESSILAEQAVHEIQFGCICRPAHRSNRYAADRYESVNHRYSALCEDNRGFALLNNGCYGVSADRGELALTLLRAPIVPDETNNQGEHRFTYALYVFNTPLAASDVARRGYELNSPITLEKGVCASPRRGLRVQEGNVILETIKPAEDGTDMILRLYNSQRTHETALLELPWIVRLDACAMDEAPGEPLGCGDRFRLAFAPFQIRTFRAARCE